MIQCNKIIVLGSNSFTGGHFIDYLLNNSDCEIIGVSRSLEYDSVFLPYLYKGKKSKRYHFKQIDINNDMDKLFLLFDDFKPDVVVNYAAQGEVRNSWKWPEQWYYTNCISVVKITEFLKDKNYIKRYISVSTPEVYGATELNISESHTYYPSTPYAASKLAGDLHLFTLFKKYNFPVIFTRAANVYGIHQQLYRIIPRAIIYLKSGRKIDLHGEGKSKRAFIHIRDVSFLTMRLILNGNNGEIYHLAPNDDIIEIRKVVKLICDLLDYKFEDSTNLIKQNYGQDSQYSLDASKVKNLFNWQQSITFEDGIKETIEWINTNWKYISNQPLDYIHKQ